MDCREYETIISKIDSVIKCRVIEEGNKVTEIHVLANNLRSAKQISRDIETALLTLVDFKIDRKIISIAQINTEYEEKVNRIRFEGISLTSNENLAICEVNLIYQGENYKVVEKGIRSQNNKKNIVAKATVKAVENILGQDNLFDIINVNLTSFSDISYVTVMVTMVFNNTEDTMIGSSIISDDMNESIAKATLDAINRRIQRTIL
ncbi:MAG: hypothetical protein ACERKV_02840 [Clostridiaceae bacterium]